MQTGLSHSFFFICSYFESLCKLSALDKFKSPRFSLDSDSSALCTLHSDHPAPDELHNPGSRLRGTALRSSPWPGATHTECKYLTFNFSYPDNN